MNNDNRPYPRFLSVLAALLFAAAPVLHAGLFSPPVTTTLSYRYTRTATSQSPSDYDVGRLAYTIDIEILSYDRNRITCSFAIRDLERVGFGDDDADNRAFPGTGTLTFNSNGTVVETTIRTYLIQPDMEGLNDFATGGLGDNDLFYRATLFYIPSFAETSLAPGDTLRQPRTPLHKNDDNSKTTVRYRLADTVLNGRETSVYRKLVYERTANTYEQPYYTYHKSSDMDSEETLWWSTVLHSAVLYESVIDNTDISGITGQVQQVNTSTTETYVRIELLAVQ